MMYENETSVTVFIDNPNNPPHPSHLTMSEPKTNAMRILDRMKKPYDVITYDPGDFVSSIEVSKKIGINIELIYKTLIAQGKSERYYAFVIPGGKELDMKRAAASVDEKSIELIHVKDINRLTGYVRGGCSPLGIKRQCKVVIDSSCNSHEKIYVSGGKLGCTLCVTPKDLIEAASAITSDISFVPPPEYRKTE